MRKLLFRVLPVFFVVPVVAQDMADYSRPGRYVIDDVTVTGVHVIDPREMAKDVGIFVGDTISIPGAYLSSAIRKLTGLGKYSYADISAETMGEGRVRLNIDLRSTPMVSEWRFEGIRSGQASVLKDKEHMDLTRVGATAPLSEYDITRHSNYIKNYFKEKGFRDTRVEVRTEEDTRYPGSGLVVATFVIDRGPKSRIGAIEFEGAEAFAQKRLRRALKNTHRVGWNFLNNFRLRDNKYAEDKDKLIDFYNSKGYRNATILGDSIYSMGPKRIGINIRVFEGNEYYYRNIRFVGNTIYATESRENSPGLAELLGVKKGDKYDRKTLYKRLGIHSGQNLQDASTLWTMYQNEGYLNANIEAVENVIGQDSIDLEVKIFEGKPFTVNKVGITGNTAVDDEVIRREIDAQPGEQYSMALVMNTMRRLGAMGHFDEMSAFPAIDQVPTSDQLVDLNWNLTEKASDQVEISGGMGAGMFIGAVSLNLRNLSSRRLLGGGKWDPYPRGQNQTLSLRAQSNGQYYKAFSASFMEPWLGGKKPVSLTVGAHYSDETTASFILQKSDDHFRTFGVSAGMGQRLRWPDARFELYNELSYTAYMLKNWGDYFIMSNGRSNIFALTTVLSRNSLDGYSIYPTDGSRFSLSLALTPPYSLLDGKDYSRTDMSEKERYKWIEYHKWKFAWEWYTPIDRNNKLILKTAAEVGYLGHYNANKLSPFEGFEMGGSGVSGYNMYGVDIVGMRGYEEGALTPVSSKGDYARVYNKFTTELRYPIVMQGATNIFGLVFAEGGNAFGSWRDFNPFAIKRAAGAGLRITLPMVGMLGLDWGYGFDAPAGSSKPHGGQLTFTFGQQF